MKSNISYLTLCSTQSVSNGNAYGDLWHWPRTNANIETKKKQKFPCITLCTVCRTEHQEWTHPKLPAHTVSYRFELPFEEDNSNFLTYFCLHRQKYLVCTKGHNISYCISLNTTPEFYFLLQVLGWGSIEKNTMIIWIHFLSIKFDIRIISRF